MNISIEMTYVIIAIIILFVILCQINNKINTNKQLINGNSKNIAKNAINAVSNTRHIAINNKNIKNNSLGIKKTFGILQLHGKTLHQIKTKLMHF